MAGRGAWWLVLACATSAPACGAPQAGEPAARPAEATREPAASVLEVRVDPRIELLCVLARLAGYQEYASPCDSPYARAAAERFAPFADHPAVRTLRLQRALRGVSHDAVVSLAVHLGELPELEERGLWEGPERSLEGRWLPPAARRFREQLRDFAQAADFAGFVREHEALYRVTEERLRALLAQRDVLGWCEAFFGAAPGARFQASPGLLTGPSSYASTVRGADGSEELHQVIGISRIDEDGLPVFEAGVLATLAHELSHAFVNPMVGRHLALFEGPGQRLFPYVEDTMRRQSYGTWRTMVCESIVRAAAARFAPEGPEREAALGYEVDQRGFLWTRELCQALGRYEADRRRWPDLDAFAEPLAAELQAWGERLQRREDELARWRQRVPELPPELEREVDRALSEALLRIGRALAAPEGQDGLDAAGRVRASLAEMRFEGDVQVSVIDADGGFVYHVQGLPGGAWAHRDLRGRALYREWSEAPEPLGLERTFDFVSADGRRARATLAAWTRLDEPRWLVVAEGHVWRAAPEAADTQAARER